MARDTLLGQNTNDDVITLPTPLDNGNLTLSEKQDSKISEHPGSTTSTPSSSSDLEAAFESASEKEVDPFLVTWNGPDDPANPMNFSFMRRIGVIATVSALTFIVPLASSMFAPGVPELMAEFHNSNSTLGSFVVSIYILGFAIEMYGRSIVYKVSTAMFTAFTLGSGECHNLTSMFILRFLCGLIGSTSIALGSGSVADVIPQEKRGKYMSFYILGPIMGPAVGPVIGGVLAAVSWRWVFRVVGIASGVMTVFTCFFLPETYGPCLLHQKAEKIRKQTGDERYHTQYEDRVSTPGKRFARTIIRPMKLLILSPLVMILSIYVAVTYGILYLLFTTFTSVFQDQYGFSTTIVGLTYLGLGLGSIVAIVIIIFCSDRILLSMAAKSPTKEKKPEYRLPIMLFLAPLNVVGLLIYGWSTYYVVHWFVPLMGTFFIGVGLLATFSPSISYLVDAYTIYAASAASASMTVRSIGGAFLPLAGPKLYAALGYGWGNTLLAGIMLLLTPVTFYIYYRGESLRKRFNPKLD